MELILEGFARALALIARGDPELVRIAALSLGVSSVATLAAAFVGVPLGAAMYLGRFRGRSLLRLAVNTGMGVPPVLVGLLVLMLLLRSGPLGDLRLLFTPGAMVIAQFLVALPYVAGLTAAVLELLDTSITEALRVDGAGGGRAAAELVRAAWPQVLAAVAAGFGRALSEVGASLMVGGNILGQTRIFTTAIALESSRGDFALALALGLILLLLALAVNGLLAVAGRPTVAASR
jgi:tungstate transport system permease protein